MLKRLRSVVTLLTKQGLAINKLQAEKFCSFFATALFVMFQLPPPQNKYINSHVFLFIDIFLF